MFSTLELEGESSPVWWATTKLNGTMRQRFLFQEKVKTKALSHTFVIKSKRKEWMPQSCI